MAIPAKIDKRLNIVLEVVRADGTIAKVHSVPILEEVFDANFLVLSKTVSRLYAEGLPYGTCTRVALNMIRHLADEMDAALPPGAPKANRLAVDQGLLPELWRQTNVLVRGPGGWETKPFQQIMDDGSTMTRDDIREVQNFLVFFTAASWVHRLIELTRQEPPGLYLIWEGSGAHLTSLNVTEYARSLPTSMPDENTGAKAAA